MSSTGAGKRVGAQEPSFICKPSDRATDFTDGEDYIELAAAYGLTADPWQEGLVTGVCARGVDGQLVAKRAGFSIPRQNGKNGALEILELGQMVLSGRKILHSAHEVKTGRKAFIRLLSFFEGNADLAKRVKYIRRTNGQEGIELDNGGSCEFIARSKSSGRGFTVDTLVLDEAQELTDEALEALMPTISAGPADDPQIIMVGTPPAPHSHYGEVFRRTHDAAHAGSDPTLWWAEWAVQAEPGVEVDPDDEDLWFQTNPALGSRIRLETIRAERAALSDFSFRRERLGMWEQEQAARVVPLEDWQQCADPNLVDDGEPVVLAVDVATGRDSASIVAAGLTRDGSPWVDVVENRRGTPNWVIPRLQAILKKQPVRALMIDVLSPAGSFIDPLEKLGISVSRTGSNIMAAACGQFYDHVMAHELRHLDQVPLNLAVASARKRRLADAWAWNRSHEDVDITPLVAATLALTGRTYQKSKKPLKPVRQKQKVVVW